MKKRLAAILASLAMIMGMGVAIAPSASAVTVHYQYELRCAPGVYPLLTYYKWYKFYDYNWYEETVLGRRDYRVFSHNDAYAYRVYYVPSPTCNHWGYILW